MTTIINSPPTEQRAESSSGMGVVIGVLIAIALIVLFVVYAFPALKSSMTPQSGSIDVNVKLPEGVTPAPAGNTGTDAPKP